MGHITAWEEDYKGNNTSPFLQSPLANSSSPSCTWKDCERFPRESRAEKRGKKSCFSVVLTSLEQNETHI
jgi:hypothetical protein